MGILTAILKLTIAGSFAFLYYLDASLKTCSAYTMVAIALDRYLSLCRPIANNRDKLPIKWMIVAILGVSFVIMSPYYMWNLENFVYFVITYAWQFVVEALIPCTLLLILTINLNKALNRLKSDKEFANYADEALKKSILKVRLSLLISSIFVISQTLVWLPSLIIMILTPNERFGSVLKNDDHDARKTIKGIGILVQVINYSSNFFAYKYFNWKGVPTTKKRPIQPTEVK